MSTPMSALHETNEQPAYHVSRVRKYPGEAEILGNGHTSHPVPEPSFTADMTIWKHSGSFNHPFERGIVC